ncbi:helix-turn-helix domain-containing protein [Beijerinckia sp. L45]|uniref:helix-turn-helix domain-containing protein n=1 Tax=Beijerinckia sp. L45 TaxID=1641855 RepID=UPI00131D78F1|nr:helix-turn-helix transcriptional regulator [Beijerinckia sp. L45]
MEPDEPSIHSGDANIFAELKRPDADTHMLKAQLVAELYRMTAERNLTQTQAGALMGLTQPEVSRLFKGTFREYSVERLMGFLTAFDRSVEIVSRPLAVGEPRGPVTLRPAKV